MLLGLGFLVPSPIYTFKSLLTIAGEKTPIFNSYSTILFSLFYLGFFFGELFDFQFFFVKNVMKVVDRWFFFWFIWSIKLQLATFFLIHTSFLLYWFGEISVLGTKAVTFFRFNISSIVLFLVFVHSYTGEMMRNQKYLRTPSDTVWCVWERLHNLISS